MVLDLLILKGANIEAKIPHTGETPLHLAACEGQVLCVSALLLGGAEKNSLDFEGRPPLFSAVIASNLEAAEELMVARADLDIRDVYSSSVLDCTAKYGLVEMLRSIIRHSGNVRACDENGLKPCTRSMTTLISSSLSCSKLELTRRQSAPQMARHLSSMSFVEEAHRMTPPAPCWREEQTTTRAITSNPRHCTLPA